MKPEYKDVTYTYKETGWADAIDDVTCREFAKVWETDKFFALIMQDTDPLNPRDDDYGIDAPAHMICFHSRYDLGDKHEEWYQKDPEVFMDWIQTQDKKQEIEALMLYLFDHGGITMSWDGRSYPYNDRWDAGRVGIIYMTKDDIREWSGKKLVTKELRARAIEYMKQEVKIYDSYLRGDTYGFSLVCKECGKNYDSVWGFIGEDWETNGLYDQIDWEHGCYECEKKEEAAWLQSQAVEV